MKQVLSFSLEMLIIMLVFAPFYAAFRFFGVKRLTRRGLATNTRHELGCAFFWALGFGILALTVLCELPIFIDGGGIHFDFTNLPRQRINLKLFDIFRLIRVETFERGKWGFFFTNFVGNIALFVPLGLLCCLLWRGIGILKALGVGLGYSLVIELCQYPLGRATDVDDLWLNALGALIGWLIYLIFKKRGSEARWRVSRLTPDTDERNV